MAPFDLDLNDTRTSLGVAAGGMKKTKLSKSPVKRKNLRRNRHLSALLPTEHFVPPGRKHADLSQQPLFRDGSAPSPSPRFGRPLQLSAPQRPAATRCPRLLWAPLMSASMLRCLTNTSYPGSLAMTSLRSPPSLLSFSSFQPHVHRRPFLFLQR